MADENIATTAYTSLRGMISELEKKFNDLILTNQKALIDSIERIESLEKKVNKEGERITATEHNHNIRIESLEKKVDGIYRSIHGISDGDYKYVWICNFCGKDYEFKVPPIPNIPFKCNKCRNDGDSKLTYCKHGTPSDVHCMECIEEPINDSEKETPSIHVYPFSSRTKEPPEAGSARQTERIEYTTDDASKIPTTHKISEPINCCFFCHAKYLHHILVEKADLERNLEKLQHFLDVYRRGAFPYPSTYIDWDNDLRNDKEKYLGEDKE